MGQVPSIEDANGWRWAKDVDPNISELDLFVNYNNEIALPRDATVVSSMRVILNNSFASLPVCGHSYATAQFIGRGPTEFSMQITGIGNYHLSRIQAMHEELEKNARFFRKFKAAASVDVSQNPLLSLCGIEDGIISSVDAQTEEGLTDLYRMNISFTSEGHHMESLSQECFVSAENYAVLLDALLRHINVRLVSREQAIESYDHWYIDALRIFGIVRDLDNQARADGAVTTSVGSLMSAARNIGANTLDETGRSLSEAGLENNTERQSHGLAIITPALGTDDQGAVFEPNFSDVPSWLHQHLTDLASDLQALMPDLPGRTFFVGNNRGRYFDLHETNLSNGQGLRTGTIPQISGAGEGPANVNRLVIFEDENSTLCTQMMRGLKRTWPSTSDIVSALNNAQAILMGRARQAFEACRGEPDFEQYFPGILANVMGSRRANLHPTYQDLDLPPHPTTGNVLDTEPDFYFFNDSEEGMLNEIGPEIIQEADYRLQNAEATMALLSTGETFANSYLGRSRVGPADLSSQGTLSNSETPFLMDGGPQSSLSMDHATMAPDADENFVNSMSSHQIGGGLAINADGFIDRALALSPTVASSNRAEGLQFRRAQMIRGSTMAIPSGEATNGIGIGPIDNAVGHNDRTNSFQREFVRSTVEQSLLQSPDTTLTMRRAFPTFKIYFLEDDIGEQRDHLLPPGSRGGRVVMYMDDFYNYNSIKEIRMIRSRKNPADLLILTLTNVSGLLEERSWLHPDEFPTEIYEAGLEETELENPLKKLVLKEGLKVQARLGNSNDPDKLGKKFNGEIVELSYNAECSDEVTIICQSYGAELTLEPKGTDPEQRAHFNDTPDMIHSIMCSPELAHFGRFSVNPNYNPAEARSIASDHNRNNMPVNGSYGDYASFFFTGLITPNETFEEIRSQLLNLRSQYIIANNPADDNIFAPSIYELSTTWQRFRQDSSQLLGWLGGLFNFGSHLGESIPVYNFLTWLPRAGAGWVGSGLDWLREQLDPMDLTPTGQTIWELLKNAELRHPGWIGHPRPYGTRMTLFFGVPTFRYWADEITQEEAQALARIRAELEGLVDDAELTRRAINIRRGNAAYTAANGGSAIPDNVPTRSDLAEEFWYRTYRDMNINRWLGSAGEYLARTMGRYRPFRRYHLVTSDNHIILNNIRASQKGIFNCVQLAYDAGTYTLKADDDIPDEYTIVESFDYSDTVNSELMARRYAIGLLQRGLKDVYKGELVVTGMDIDPYDCCYVHDERANLFGAFEVEQVVDTFTAETGWITEITPDLITGTNEWSTMSTRAAREAALGAISQRYLGYRLNAYSFAGMAVAGTALAAIPGMGAVETGVAAAAVTDSSGIIAASTVVGAGGIVTIPVGAAIAWIGGYYVTRWTQDRQPIWVSPLILGNRPFISGLNGFKQDGLFASLRGRWVAEFNAAEQGWRQFHLGAYFSDLTITTSQRMAGQLM